VRAADLTTEAREAAMLPWDRTGIAKRGRAVLYQSRALDAFTLAPPWLPYVVMGPVAIAVLVPALLALPPWLVVLEVVLGGLGWTLVEYLMHRFLFHARAESEAARVVLLLVHGHHHVWPDDPRRVAATPLQFGSLALLFWGLFSLALPTLEAMATFSGFLFAYLAYEAVHYAVHQGRSRGASMAWLRRYHMQHHHEDPCSRWGIGSPLWDFVLGTQGKRMAPKAGTGP
jgi:sterol desaturase/sphingolipid hydroxylase (fatty acid hydroxylase superfamily)